MRSEWPEKFEYKNIFCKYEKNYFEKCEQVPLNLVVLPTMYQRQKCLTYKKLVISFADVRTWEYSEKDQLGLVLKNFMRKRQS